MQLGQERQIPWGGIADCFGQWGLLWGGSIIGHLTSYLSVPQEPSEFKERSAALRCPGLWLARLGGHAQERTGIILASEDLTAKVRR